jgi:DNA-binding NarL/FixJ family response regulator
MPISQDITNGLEVIDNINCYQKCSKLIISTSYTQALLLYDVYKKYRPDGLLVKSDITANEFLNAFEQIKNGNQYHSETVSRQFQKLLSIESYLDNYNRQIISLLAKGVRTKDLSKYLPLSQSAIDKRKSQIRYLIANQNEQDILSAAKTLGLV